MEVYQWYWSHFSHPILLSDRNTTYHTTNNITLNTIIPRFPLTLPLATLNIIPQCNTLINLSDHLHFTTSQSYTSKQENLGTHHLTKIGRTNKKGRNAQFFSNSVFFFADVSHSFWLISMYLQLVTMFNLLRIYQRPKETLRNLSTRVPQHEKKEIENLVFIPPPLSLTNIP